MSVLLFLLGLKLDLRRVRHIGPVALATGLGHLGFTIAFGFLIILALGKAVLEALHVVAAPLLAQVSLAALAMFLLMRYLLSRLVAIMARSQELLLVFAIAWGTRHAALGEAAGFSKGAGAFLAGFSLASTA